MADEVVRVRFVAVGHDQLESIFRSIPERAKRMGGGLQAAGRQGAAAARQTGQAWSAAGRPMSETQRLALRVARDQERGAKRTADTQIREAKRAAQETSRAQIREHRAEVGRQRRLLETQRRALERHATQGVQLARRLDSARGAGRRTLIERAAGAATRVGGSLVTGAAGLAGLGVAAAGAAVGGALREGVVLQDQARAISRQGGGKVDPTILRKEIEKTALDVKGVKASDVGGAIESFVTKTGDLDAARRFQKTFAEISLATGTAAQDIGSAAADLFEKFDVKTLDDMSSALAILTAQGKRGSFELRDAASQFPKVAGAAARFGLDKGVTGVSTLGGLMQIAKRTTGSPEQAATAVEAMFRQLVGKSDDIGKLKVGGKAVSVFKDKGKTQTNDIRETLVNTIAGAGGNLETLQKIFDEQGIRAISPLVGTFNQARSSATGTEAEKTAVAMKKLREEIDKAIDAEGATAEVARDLAGAQQDSSARLTAAWESFRSGVTDQLMPSFLSAVDQLAGIDWATLGATLATLTGQAIGAAEALGLLSSKRTTEDEAELAGINAGKEAVYARGEKLAIESQRMLRGKHTPQGFVPGELTVEEKRRVGELDAQIDASTREEASQGAIAASAKRFEDVPTMQFLGITNKDIESDVGHSGRAAGLDASAGAGGIAEAAAQVQAGLVNLGAATEGVTGFQAAIMAVAEAARSAATELARVQRPSIREPG